MSEEEQELSSIHEEIESALKPIIAKHMISTIVVAFTTRDQTGTGSHNWYDGSNIEAIGLCEASRFDFLMQMERNNPRGLT